MSKDVVIAGVIVAACLGLVVVAFTLPKKAPRPVDSSESNSLTSEGTGGSPTLPGDTIGTGTPDSYGSGSTGGGFGSTTPDSSGLGSTTTPGYGSTGTPDTSGYGSTTTPGTGGYGSTTTPGFGSTTTPGTGGYGSTTTPGFGSTTTPGTGGYGSTTTPGFGSTTTPGFGSTTTPGLGGTETTTPVPPSGEKTHVVAKGETLGDISMKYYGTSKHWKKIKEANNQIDPSNMQVGAKLTIPEVAAPATTTTETPGTGTPVANDRSYKIRAGDTYYSIAKHELGSAARWKEIERLNKLAPEDLRVGMSIKLPAKEKDPAVSTPGAETGTGTTTDPTTDTSASGKTHVVAAGETLGDISKKYYGTTTKWREIAKANAGIEPEAMKVGQKLVIPEIAGLAPSAGTAPTTDSGAALGGAEYVVKGGDTLESIALSQLGKKSEAKKILEANPGVNPRKLRIGQKLVIPGKAADGAPAGGVVPAPERLPAPITPAPGDTLPFPNLLPPPPGGTLPDFNFGNPSRLGDGTGSSTLPPPVTPGSNPTM